MSDPRPRVVLVDGVPMSGLIAAADEPRGVIVAFHGGQAPQRISTVPAIRGCRCCARALRSATP